MTTTPIATDTLDNPPHAAFIVQAIRERPRHYSVRDAANIVADGTTNDRAALQALIDAAPDNSTIDFTGLTALQAAGAVTITNRSNLRFTGAGALVTKSSGSANKLFVLAGSDNIHFEKLTLDANNTQAFSGLICIEGGNNRIFADRIVFTDSNPRATGGADFYGINAVPSGGVPNTHIRVTNCDFEYLDCEIDGCSDVQVRGGTSTNARGAVAYGIFSVNHSEVHEDYLFEGLTVINPEKHAFTALIDTGAWNNGTFRRITFRGNTVHYDNAVSTPFSIGTPTTTTASSGNVFKDINVIDNTVILDAATSSLEFIQFQSSTTANFVFDRCTARGNRLYGFGSSGTAVRVARFQNGDISANVGRNLNRLITATTDILNTTFLDNVGYSLAVEGFNYGPSLGGNIIRGTVFPGTPPTTKYNVAGGFHSTDRLDDYDPTLHKYTVRDGATTRGVTLA